MKLKLTTTAFALHPGNMSTMQFGPEPGGLQLRGSPSTHTADAENFTMRPGVAPVSPGAGSVVAFCAGGRLQRRRSREP